MHTQHRRSLKCTVQRVPGSPSGSADARNDPSLSTSPHPLTRLRPGGSVLALGPITGQPATDIDADVPPEVPRSLLDAGVDLRLLDPERQRTYLLLHPRPWLNGYGNPLASDSRAAWRSPTLRGPE